jgi:hypothetical protein
MMVPWKQLGGWVDVGVSVPLPLPGLFGVGDHGWSIGTRDEYILLRRGSPGDAPQRLMSYYCSELGGGWSSASRSWELYTNQGRSTFEASDSYVTMK